MTEELKTIETVDMSPFKYMVMTIGELPSSFVESMTYYEALAWLDNYLENTVIPAINNNAEVSEELQGKFLELDAKFDELHSYVEHYFDNLDVQQEINNKIDQMAEDGYFTDLITPIVQETINDLSSEVQAGLIEAENAGYNINTDKIRKEQYKKYNLVTLPAALNNDFFKDINVFTNGERNYIVNYNLDKYKNSGGDTWYFAPDGSNSAAGDSEHPFKSINDVVWAQISDGDTLIFKEGHYPKSTWPISKKGKTLNVIGQGDVWFSTSDLNYVWDQYATNVWHTTRSGINAIYDITRLDEGITPALTLVNDLASVGTTPNSYYKSGSDVYVHMYNNVTPSNDTIELSLGTGNVWLQFEPEADGKIYIENINCISAANGGIVVNNNSNNVSVVLKNCKIYNVYCGNYATDAFSNQGCNSICDNVQIINSRKDGFNYHSANAIDANGVEINCSATNMGEGQVGSGYLSNNATTAHNGCQVLRVNGIYTYCNGGVITDIDTVVSAQYNCVAIDSYGRSYDIYAAGTSSMYVYDCYCKGSRADTNLLTNETAHIYYNDGTLYDTKSGNVTLLS